MAYNELKRLIKKRVFSDDSIMSKKGYDQLIDYINTMIENTEYVKDNLGGSSGGGDGHINICLHAYDSKTVDASYNNPAGLGMVWNMLSNLNDQIIYKMYLQAGTYSLRICSYKYSVCGIGSFYLNAVKIGEVDFFFEGEFPNQVYDSILDITVAVAGIYDFKIKMESKNVGSIGYQIYLYGIGLWRTV